jgi:hypothetical protein
MRQMFWVSAALLIFLVGTAFWPGGHEATLSMVTADAAPSAAVAISKSIPATINEVNGAIERVFGSAVVPIDVANPVYISEDLNGDGASDLAVMVRVPDKSVADVNSEVANWSVQDVVKADVPAATGNLASVKGARIHVHANEQMLAVVHGYGERGWRSAEAKQAYLLANADADRLRVVTFSELNSLGVALPRMSANPSRGLVEKSNNEWTVVYWTGAQYAAVKVKKPLDDKEILAAKDSMH